VRFLILTAGMWAIALLAGTAVHAEGPDPTIQALLTHANHKVRIKAAKKLLRVEGPAARDALLAAAADDENALVRAAAANSLKGHPSSASIGTLCGLLGDTDDFVRRTASRSLKGFGGTAGCPVWLRLEITGDTGEMQAHVREKVAALLADEPRVRITEAVPSTVVKGVLRGYELKLRLERKIERAPDKLTLSCSITQSIFDLRHNNLRGSATQRGSLTLGPKAPDSIVTKQISACMDALAPVVHSGLNDFLARSRR